MSPSLVRWADNAKRKREPRGLPDELTREEKAMTLRMLAYVPRAVVREREREARLYRSDAADVERAEKRLGPEPPPPDFRYLEPQWNAAKPAVSSQLSAVSPEAPAAGAQPATEPTPNSQTIPRKPPERARRSQTLPIISVMIAGKGGR